VDTLLCGRLNAFITAQRELKDMRRRFDRAGHEYEVARERHLSLRQSAAPEELSRSQAELTTARNAFDRARYTLMSGLATENRFETVEAVADAMAAHRRYFQQVCDKGREGHEEGGEPQTLVQEVVGAQIAAE